MKNNKNIAPKKQNETMHTTAFKSHNAYSFYIWSRIFPRGYNFILWMLLGIVGVSFVGFYFLLGDEAIWLIYLGTVCAGIFLLRWTIEFLRKVSTYSAYKKFPDTLGFKLEGWDELGSYPLQLKFRHWSKNTTVEIVLSGSASKTQISYLRDALFLFMSKANEKFYEAEMGRDGRKNWEYNNALKIAGSSDREVIGEMYILLNDYLKGIQAKHSSISIVKIKFDPDIFLVEPPHSND